MFPSHPLWKTLPAIESPSRMNAALYMRNAEPMTKPWVLS